MRRTRLIVAAGVLSVAFVGLALARPGPTPPSAAGCTANCTLTGTTTTSALIASTLAASGLITSTAGDNSGDDSIFQSVIPGPVTVAELMNFGTTGAGWCFRQGASCSTSTAAFFGTSAVSVVNAPTGGTVALRINNASKLFIDANGTTIGQAGNAIAASYTATATIDFADLGAGYSCADSSDITVTGAAANAACDVGSPDLSAAVTYQVTCYVRTTNVVRARACGTGNPASATFRVRTFL